MPLLNTGRTITSTPAPKVRVRTAVFCRPHIRRTLIKQSPASPSRSPGVFVPQRLLWQVPSTGFGNRWPAGTKDYLFVRNTHASEVRTVTMRSAPDPTFARSGDLSLSLSPAGQPGDSGVLGPIVRAGWMQGDGFMWVDVQTADVELLPMSFV